LLAISRSCTPLEPARAGSIQNRQMELTPVLLHIWIGPSIGKRKQSTLISIEQQQNPLEPGNY
jgi:hypothetical protein